MKKFLVLALVMGIASFAAAGVELSANDEFVDVVMPGPITIGLVSDAPATGFDKVYWILCDSAELTNGQNLTGEMMLTVIEPVTGGWKMAAATFASPIAAGKWFSVDVEGKLGDVIQLYGQDAGGNIDRSVVLDTVTIIPEPMTVALLGLGGLFLRRRK